MEFNRQHNVNAGYTVSFMGVSSRSRGAISLAAKPSSQEDVDKIWAEKGDEIQLMNNVAHLKIMSLPHLTNSGERLTRPSTRGIGMGVRWENNAGYRNLDGIDPSYG